MSAVDDSRGDVRRQPGKAQEGVDVGGGDSFRARDVMHGQLRVLNEPTLTRVKVQRWDLERVPNAELL